MTALLMTAVNSDALFASARIFMLTDAIPTCPLWTHL